MILNHQPTSAPASRPATPEAGRNGDGHVEPIRLVLSRFPDARQTGERQWEAKCPCHGDRKPSLQIGVIGESTVGIKCLAGCETSAVLQSVGLEFCDLFSQNGRARRRGDGFETAEAAIAFLESKMGPHTRRSDYPNEAGQLFGIILRWDTADGKEIRPVSRIGNGWKIKGMPEPRPLYRLSELAGAQRAYVFEGEPAADAARSIGLIATTSPHGSKSAKKADWRPLAGKEVVILPDADKAGEHYARDVVSILRRNDAMYDTPGRTKIKIVRLPGLPEGGDLVDWIDRHDAVESESLKATIEGMVDAAESADVAEREEKPKDTAPRFIQQLITSAELVDLDTKIDFLVQGVLVRGQNAVGGGGPKTVKTGIIGIDLGLSVAAGVPFLGKFEATQGNVLLCTAESGDATIQRNAKTIAAAKGIDLRDCPMFWTFATPQLSRLEHLDALKAVIVERELSLVIIDPLYLSLLDVATAGNARNVFAMGSALLPLSEIGQATGCTILVIHHFRKNGTVNENEPAGLEELSQSGTAEWARQWILLQRRTPYQHDGRHELWMRLGGSAGHCGLWGVTVDEGVFPERIWEVDVQPISDTRAEAQRDRERRKSEEQERREDDHRRRLHEVLRKFPGGETARILRLAAGLNPDNFARAAQSMLSRGELTTAEVTKGGGRYEGFVLTEEGRR